MRVFLFWSYTFPKTNMTGWKIRHAWRCMDLIEHGDFPASHASFRGCRLFGKWWTQFKERKNLLWKPQIYEIDWHPWLQTHTPIKHGAQIYRVLIALSRGWLTVEGSGGSHTTTGLGLEAGPTRAEAELQCPWGVAVTKWILLTWIHGTRRIAKQNL